MALGIVSRKDFTIEIRNTFNDELRTFVVVLIGVATGIVGVVAGNYRNSGIK
jgi:hypothetical protein